MFEFKQGNLLESGAQALVNTVNTVGVMGKGIALMFKERFPHNFQLYANACKQKQVQTGRIFVTETGELSGPRWIVNFPTKQHWRGNSRIDWIVEGLSDLRAWLESNHVESIALPPLGAGNGGLDWAEVKPHIVEGLSGIQTHVLVYEPTEKYQNVQKRSGVEKLTNARALVSELVRRYSVLGMECSLLEIQKLCWFLERSLEREATESPLELKFRAHFYGPYAEKLPHLLNSLDGSYLHCEKRISDAAPWEALWFDDAKKSLVGAYLQSEAKEYLTALEETTKVIDGFQSPFGMELLATCDWLISKQGIEPNVDALRQGIHNWPSKDWAAERKARIFTDQVLEVAVRHLEKCGWLSPLH